jgi:predicted ATPase
VPATVAAAMRMELGAGDHTQVLIAALRHTKTLLLQDNCEHLIDTVANFAALITQHCPDVALLGTSREPFRIPGEVVYSLSPLASPADAASLTAEDALTYPAVQLLVERVRAATNGFALVDENAPLAGAICRQLDGLPLAIELASPLIGVFGLAGLASRLDTPLLRIIQTNKRGASVRHRTLSAALDWSYGLLDDNERTALRRLAVFAGGFTLKGAGAVIDVPDLGQVGAMLARLHGKSLIANDITPTDLRFRLLQTTRAYAVEKLELHDDAHDVRRRHAAHVIDLLESQGGELRTSGDSRDLIDEVHQALDWTLSLQGDQRLGLELIVASAPLWFDLRSACKPHALGRLPIEAAAQINSSEPHLTARLRDIRDHNKFADGSATEAQRLIREMGRQHAEMTPSPRPRETACARRSTASF